MRLPRRVPWASLGELDQVCNWIYADENDFEAKLAAINTLSAWRFSTSLPHALDSAVSLLVVILQDKPALPAHNAISLRQSYALALVRMVNGLVDPLQSGFYARSIASIAAQIGLPAWLVEMRHAATHEDLPSLELLREGAREAMVWLLHNYFLPTLSPAPDQELQANSSKMLEPLLLEYKSIMKVIIKDVSLRPENETQIKRIIREIERCANEISGATWSSGAASLFPAENDREQWVLNILCDRLLRVGNIVPLSKRKRSPVGPSGVPSNVAIWEPLLETFQAHHPSFTMTMISLILDRLLVPAADSSYDVCLAAWLLWIINEWGSLCGYNKTGVMAALIAGAGQAQLPPSPVVQNLIQDLTSHDPDLETTANFLVDALSSPRVEESWNPDSLDVMRRRLTCVQNRFQASPTATFLSVPGDSGICHSMTAGWRLLDTSSGWKPCPIGASNKPR